MAELFYWTKTGFFILQIFNLILLLRCTYCQGMQHQQWLWPFTETKGRQTRKLETHETVKSISNTEVKSLTGNDATLCQCRVSCLFQRNIVDGLSAFMFEPVKKNRSQTLCLWRKTAPINCLWTLKCCVGPFLSKYFPRRRKLLYFAIFSTYKNSQNHEMCPNAWVEPHFSLTHMEKNKRENKRNHRNYEQNEEKEPKKTSFDLYR